MTSTRSLLVLVFVVTACGGDDGVRHLPDAPVPDGPTDATDPDAPIDGSDDVDLTIARTGSGTGRVSSTPVGLDCGSTCTAGFPAATMVTLTAEPDVGSLFGGWTGACSGTSPVCEVTLSAATSVTATFTLATYTVTVSKVGVGTGTVTGNGIACGATCTAIVDHGTTITLAAAPGALSTFTGWGGPCTGTGTCMIPITADTTITAAFALDDITLTVVKSGTGTGTVTSSPAGISCGTDCDETYVANTLVTLTGAPATGSTFMGWSGGGCSGSQPCTITMTAAALVTATFLLNTYPLTVSTTGNGGGNVTSMPGGIACGADCSETYDHGQMVTLTATPSTGSTFVWSGACTGSGACVVTMDAAKSVTATFTLDMYALGVTTGGTGTGTVSSMPAGITCPGDCTQNYSHGQLVTLTAMPAVGSTLVWSGACIGSGACVVTMDAAKSVTATFTLNTYALTVTADGNGAGTVSSTPGGIACPGDCAELYDHGQLVTLTAMPATGSTFAWSGACTGTGSCVVPMDAAKSVTATFTLDTYALTVTTGGTGMGTVASTPGGITCPGDCSEVYDHGQMITLTATPATGSTFVWSGACTGTGACVVTMDAVKTVTATFTLNTYALTAATAGTGTGTVTSVPAGIACPGDCTETLDHGQLVTLTATPTGASAFTGWSGDCTGVGVCTVTMTAARSVTATFMPTFVLTVTLGGTGTGTVTSTPAGINCGADCSESYLGGTSVTLTATPPTFSMFAGWTGAGCAGTGTCVVSMTAARAVTATFSAPNIMFVSSSLHTGNLGGVAGADATCRTLATSAGLLGTGPGKNATWRAWLSSSTSGTDAVTRMGSANGWIRPDGKPVFGTVADIAQNKLIYPPRLTESSADVGSFQRVWTGTNASGTYSGSQCFGGAAALVPWGGTSGPGTVGFASGDSSIFTTFTTFNCSLQQARLYCMGIDRTSPVAATAETGRFAFTSTASYTPDSTGLVKADNICKAEAMAAGLSGTYLALLSTTTASAISRFSTGSTTLPWIRTGDRIRIAPTAAALGSASLDVLTVAPNVNATGTTRFGDIPMWTGSLTPGSLGQLGVTCGDWTQASGKGQGGRAGDTGATDLWFGFRGDTGLTCDATGRRVICLQE